MVRIGKTFYGGYHGYRTALKVVSKVTALQHVAAGSKIGYGGTETAARPTVVGVVPCGYADLVHINYSNTLCVLVDDTPCKILGRICMDSFMIDVTNVQAPLGKRVTIIDDRKGLTIMEIAEKTGCIACNMFCSLNFQRSELIYKR
jgi:alanine racemase